MEAKDLSILHSQYHGCWWPGDASRRGISSYGTGLVCPKHSSFITQRVNYNRTKNKYNSALFYIKIT